MINAASATYEKKKYCQSGMRTTSRVNIFIFSATYMMMIIIVMMLSNIKITRCEKHFSTSNNTVALNMNKFF
jgi:hypothetical protein